MELNKNNFVRIVEFHQGIIKSLCKAYYPSHEDQKDVFQDVVLQLWKSFDTFRGDSQISTWIYKVSLNTILARGRREERIILTESMDDADLPLSNARADDDVELLNQLIQVLKDQDKAIVILYLDGYKNKEIAQILDVTATNVSTRLNRVRTELKARFKSQHYEFK